jgi:Arc/MetJ-type ribon-helix-helix transcriptional regulator
MQTICNMESRTTSEVNCNGEFVMNDLQDSMPDTMREFAGAQVSCGRFASIDEYLQALVAADQHSQQDLAMVGKNRELAGLLRGG